MSGSFAVYKAVAACMADLAKEGISKNRSNQQQGYKFRGIDDVYDALAPILSKHGLCFLPRILSRQCEERQTVKGNPLFYVTVEAEFDLVSAEDGSRHTVRTFGEAMDSADKATNKAMSAAYKYAAFQAFCIPCEGEDADSTTHAVKPVSPVGPKPAARQSEPSPTIATLSDAQNKLTDELRALWGDDKEAQADCLRQNSHYEKDGKAGHLKLADLTTPNANPAFQRWVGATLAKVRAEKEKLGK